MVGGTGRQMNRGTKEIVKTGAASIKEYVSKKLTARRPF